MASDLDQFGRLGEFECDLPSNTFVLQRFSGREALQSHFEFTVDLFSEKDDIDIEALLGTQGGVVVNGKDGKIHFNGIIVDGAWLGSESHLFRYTVTLVSWTKIAAHRRRQRIFHEKTVIDILKEVFKDYEDLGKCDIKTAQSYRPLEYTVQYGESDFDFAARMMERFGLNFHFEHSDGHKMVVTDGLDSLPKIPGDSREYLPLQEEHQSDAEHFSSFRGRGSFRSGAVKVTDYNFETSNAKMSFTEASDKKYKMGKLEIDAFPGDFSDGDGGKKVAALRLAQAQTGGQRFDAIGNTVNLRPGMRVKVESEYPLPKGAKDQELVCVSARYNFTADSYTSGGGVSTEQPFTGTYTFASSAQRLVPPIKAERPRILGPQTGKVVGSGEIDCDEHGRILVRFHWDHDDATSMRCRVSQNWAGSGFGGMVIPRVGMEVVVQFINGDPDAPLVTGCVYNDQNTPHYDPKANKTKSVFKTETHGGGGFNELSFEDEAGEELIYMHGEKDQKIEIGNNRETTIGANQTETVGADKSITVGGAHDESIGTNMSVTIASDLSTSAGNKIESTSITHEVTAAVSITLTGAGGVIKIDPSGVTITAPLIRLAGKVMMGP